MVCWVFLVPTSFFRNLFPRHLDAPSPKSPLRIVFALVMILLVKTFTSSATAQVFDNDARTAAQGNVGAALTSQVAGMLNPATTTQVKSTTVYAFASRAFGLSELQLIAFGLNHPIRNSNASVFIRSFGFDAYRRTRFGISFSRPMNFGSTRHMYVGGRLALHNTAIQNYGSATTAAASTGILFMIADHTRVGAGWTGIRIARLSPNLPLEQNLTVGASHNIGRDVTSSIDIQIGDGTSIRSGIEYWPVRILALRSGYATRPRQPTFGFGIIVPHMRSDVAVAWHSELGFTTSASLEVSL